MLYIIIHLPAFPIGFCFAMPCWKQHLELLTVQRWTLPIKIGIKKTILGDSTLISYPESPVTTTYFISYTSCGISVVDTVVTIAEWQLFSGRLSCTKYPACKTGYDLAFIVHLPNIFSIYTLTRNIFLILYHFNKTVQKFKGEKRFKVSGSFIFPFESVEFL